MSFFEKLKQGLERTRQSMSRGSVALFSFGKKIDEEFFEQLEEALIVSDVGVNMANDICLKLKKAAKKNNILETEELKKEFIDIVSQGLSQNAVAKDDVVPKASSCPQKVILVVGVNGVGKTTTVGKLAYNLKLKGHSVMVAAADTFRDAAVPQLEAWAKMADVEIVKKEETSDPSAVVFDAVRAAQAKGVEILICDTAGRLHNKKNLMEQLAKIKRILEKLCLQANQEVFLVLDATTGQNAISQAKEFKNMVNITGLILTKLDGSAKGGAAISIANELGVPIKYVGLGEGLLDLEEFDSKSFAEALFL